MKHFLTLIILCLSTVVSAQSDFYSRLSDAALALTKHHVTYDGHYYVIDYPNGDIPSDKGVCTDVIIRAYRQLEIDLQTGEVRNLTTGQVYRAKPYPKFMMDIIDAGGLIEFTLRRIEAERKGQ